MKTKESRNKVAKSISLQAATIKRVEDARDIYDEYDFSYRVDTLLNTHLSMMDYTKLELKGRFTESEVSLLIDCLNGYIYTYQVNPVVSLHSRVVDSIDLSGLDKLWDVDKVVLSQKLINLTAAQAVCVVGMATEFWNRSGLDGSEPKASDIFLF